jgi:hypothetical protein
VYNLFAVVTGHDPSKLPPNFNLSLFMTPNLVTDITDTHTSIEKCIRACFEIGRTKYLKLLEGKVDKSFVAGKPGGLAQFSDKSKKVMPRKRRVDVDSELFLERITDLVPPVRIERPKRSELERPRSASPEEARVYRNVLETMREKGSRRGKSADTKNPIPATPRTVLTFQPFQPSPLSTVPASATQSLKDNENSDMTPKLYRKTEATPLPKSAPSLPVSASFEQLLRDQERSIQMLEAMTSTLVLQREGLWTANQDATFPQRGPNCSYSPSDLVYRCSPV